MKIERMIGCKEIAQRLADAIDSEYPNSRHVFPDSSFMLFGPSDCTGVFGDSRKKPSRVK